MTDDPTDPLARLRLHRPLDAAEPAPRRAAVAAVLRPGPRGHEVLLMKRAERPGDPWSGQIALPGGRAEPIDADLAATARREVLEEVRLDLAADAELLCRLAALRARAQGKLLELDVTPFVFRLLRPVDAVPDRVEAQAVFWLPLAAAARGELDAQHPYEHGGARLQLPAWRFEGHLVWGMTHRMLQGLVRAAGF